MAAAVVVTAAATAAVAADVMTDLLLEETTVALGTPVPVDVTVALEDVAQRAEEEGAIAIDARGPHRREPRDRKTALVPETGVARESKRRTRRRTKNHERNENPLVPFLHPRVLSMAR